MKKRLIVFFILVTAYWCHASNTNKVWLTGPYSSSYTLDTNIDYAALPRIIANEEMPGMVLSAETNSLKNGVWMDDTNHILVVRNGEIVDQHATVVTLNTSTNKIHFWYFWPSTDLQFQIKLVDNKGNEVPKTTYGKRFGRSPKQNLDNLDVLGAHDPRTYGLDNMSILPQGDFLEETMRYNPIRSLLQCFEIKEPGNYKFTLIRHIYITEQRTNGLFLKPITFSPVIIDVFIESMGK